MRKIEYDSVDAYIRAQTDLLQRVLTQVRGAIRKAVPEAEEVISYNMPAYKLNGERLLFFAGWKRHYSIYPANDGIVAAFGKELSSFKVDKGTIQFPLSKPVPVDLIGRIAKFRAEQLSRSNTPRSNT